MLSKITRRKTAIEQKRTYCEPPFPEKQKHINQNKCAAFWAHSLWGEKRINKILPKSRDSPVKILFMCLSCQLKGGWGGCFKFSSRGSHGFRCSRGFSEELCVSHQSVSGFPERRANLWGGPEKMLEDLSNTIHIYCSDSLARQSHFIGKSVTMVEVDALISPSMREMEHNPFAWKTPKPLHDYPTQSRPKMYPCKSSSCIANPIPNFQRAPHPPEFAQLGLSRPNSSHPQREGTNLGVFVPVWLVLRRCEATNFWCVWSASFRPAQARLCNFVWVWSSLKLCCIRRCALILRKC